MYRLQVKSHFDAAHFIRDYPGKCSRMHGHRWEVEVVLEGRKLDNRNILVDFAQVKELLGSLVDSVDHYQLNERFEDEPNVTAEYLAKWFYDCLTELIKYEWARVVGVTVWESPDCCVKYYGEE